VAFRAHPDVEPALTRRAADGFVQVQLIRRAFAGETAQAAQRHLDIAGAQFPAVVEILELALFPDLDGALVAAFAADADAFGIIAAMAEGGRAAGADPLVAALMAGLLFFEPPFQGHHRR